MTDLKTGGPAFPHRSSQGMTLRDYIAIRARPEDIQEFYEYVPDDCGDFVTGSHTARYAYADAMIEARDKK